MYFVLIMEKVQTGQVIEFYSNSCLVKTKFGKFECIAIKNIVVGDFVNLEIIQDSKKFLGKILKINQRLTNKNFVEKAPAELIDQEKTNFNNLEKDVKKIQLTLENL